MQAPNLHALERQSELREHVFPVVSRGVAAGNELEYTDEVTLGRSIINRIPFEGSLKL